MPHDTLIPLARILEICSTQDREEIQASHAEADKTRRAVHIGRSYLARLLIDKFNTLAAEYDPINSRQLVDERARIIDPTIWAERDAMVANLMSREWQISIAAATDAANNEYEAALKPSRDQARAELEATSRKVEMEAAYRQGVQAVVAWHHRQAEIAQHAVASEVQAERAQLLTQRALRHITHARDIQAALHSQELIPLTTNQKDA